MLTFLIAPVGYALYTSLTEWNGLSAPTWVGLQNYLEFLKDPVFMRSWMNTLVWVGMTLLLPVTFGLVLAMAANLIRHPSAQRVYKSVFYLPLALSTTATGVIWKWIYSRTGLLNSALMALGVIATPRSWLLEVNWNTLAMIVSATWQMTGMNMILFLLGLQNLPTEPLEAAKIDGATSFQVFRYITLPMLRPITTVIVTMNMISGFKTFDIIWVMTTGGPYRASETLAVTMYREAFALFKMGYGNAIAMLLSCIVLAIGSVYVRNATRSYEK